MSHPGEALRPATVCHALLAALDAADGRRRSRKRDQTPDAIGLTIKRSLLTRVVEDDPDSETFEEWLMNYPRTCAASEQSGAVAAMARSVLEEWQLAHASQAFRAWLEDGAPSDDARSEHQREGPGQLA